MKSIDPADPAFKLLLKAIDVIEELIGMLEMDAEIFVAMGCAPDLVRPPDYMALRESAAALVHQVRPLRSETIQ